MTLQMQQVAHWSISTRKISVKRQTFLTALHINYIYLTFLIIFLGHLATQKIFSLHINERIIFLLDYLDSVYIKEICKKLVSICSDAKAILFTNTDEYRNKSIFTIYKL